MSTKSSMMGLNVTYNFGSEQIFLSKLPQDLKIKYGEMELFNNETRLIGVVKLRDCIQAVMKSSPELLSNLATSHDYNIYVCDYSEVDTPLVGYGTLSKLIKCDFTDEDSKGKKAKDILIPGKVIPNMTNLLYQNKKSKEVLSVKLSLKKMENAPKPNFNDLAVSIAPRAKRSNTTIITRKPHKKKAINPNPAPKATRTLSMPNRPIELLKRTNNDFEVFNQNNKKSKPNIAPKSSDRFYNHNMFSLQQIHHPSPLINTKLNQQLPQRNNKSSRKSKPTSTNYWIIKDDNANKENIPPFSSSSMDSLSSSSNFMNSHQNPSSSSLLSDEIDENNNNNNSKSTISDEQLQNELNNLFDFDTNFLNEIYESSIDVNLLNEKPKNSSLPPLPSSSTLVKSKKIKAFPNVTTPEDNSNETPKDSEILTPIMESSSDKEATSPDIVTSPVYDSGDEKFPLMSSPFTVYE